MIKPQTIFYNLALTILLFVISMLVGYLSQQLFKAGQGPWVWSHPISFLIVVIIHYTITTDHPEKPKVFPYQILPILLMTGIGAWVVNLSLWEYILPVPNYQPPIELTPNLSIFLVMCVFAPILEEALFRGIILKNLIPAINPHLAIAFSAFLFAAIHFNIIQSTTALLVGFLVGYIYWWTRSLIACISLHALINSISFIFINKLPDAPSYYIPSSFIWLAILSLVVIGYTIWFIKEKKKINANTTILHLTAFIGFGVFSYTNLQSIRPLTLKEAIQKVQKNDLLLLSFRDSSFTYAKVVEQAPKYIILQDGDISSTYLDRIVESIMMDDFSENGKYKKWSKNDPLFAERVISIYRNKKSLVPDDTK